MAISEKSRHELYTRLQETLGDTAAATLMEHLPPVGWADVATKRDIDTLGAATKRDIDTLRAATKRDLDTLGAATKRDIDTLGAATKRDLDVLRSDLNGVEHRLRADFRAEINAAVTSQTRTLVFAVIGSNVTMAALAFAAASTR